MRNLKHRIAPEPFALTQRPFKGKIDRVLPEGIYNSDGINLFFNALLLDAVAEIKSIRRPLPKHLHNGIASAYYIRRLKQEKEQNLEGFQNFLDGDLLELICKVLHFPFQQTRLILIQALKGLRPVDKIVAYIRPCTNKSPILQKVEE